MDDSSQSSEPEHSDFDEESANADFDFDFDIRGENLDDGEEEEEDEVAKAIRFDVEGLPDGLAAADPGSQTEVMQALYQKVDTRAHYVEAFNRAPVEKVQLSKLRKEYATKNKTKAFRRLRKRTQVDVDSEFLFDTNDPEIVWDIEAHYVDFLLLVSSQVGLHAILPVRGGGMDYTLLLDLSWRFAKWQEGKLDLPFETDECVLRVGSRGLQQAWLAMVPRSFVGDGGDGDDDGDDDTPKRGPPGKGANRPMKTSHYCMIVMMLATMLSRNRTRDIYMREDYPEEVSIRSIRKLSNILGDNGEPHKKHELRLEDTKKLHDSLMEGYDDWVAAAPASWKRDGFLTKNVPIIISCRYGQNQAIAVDGEEVIERNHWDRSQNYQCIHTMYIALASHLTCSPVLEWQNIDPNDLPAPLYDSPHPHNRTEVDIHRYDLFDDGVEKKVYNEQGFRVARRVALTGDTGGILASLTNLHDLFSSPEYEPVDYDPDMEDQAMVQRRNNVKYDVYPMSGLKKYGHWSAKGVIGLFKDGIDKVNGDLMPRDPDGEDEDRNDGLFSDIRDPVVVPISSQGYNQLSHRVRSDARHHNVQVGMITAALAGSHARTDATRRRAAKHFDKCDISLPYERYNEKVGNGEDVPQAFRVENVYKIKVSQLRPEDRRGSHIYGKVILPLIEEWGHPRVLETLKEHLVVFKPQILPQIVKWTSYGLTSLLDELWRRRKTATRTYVPVNPYMVETASALERALNFLHTGNARVIATRTMDPMGLGMGLVQDGMPMISDLIRLAPVGEKSINIQAHEWPTDAQTRKPFISSHRSQILNYGAVHFARIFGRRTSACCAEFRRTIFAESEKPGNSYEAYFHISHALDNIPPDAFPTIRDRDKRYAAYAACIALRVYMAEAVSFVVSEVAKKLNNLALSSDRSDRANAKIRQGALKKWREHADPFGPNEPYNLLVRASVGDNIGNGLPLSNQGNKSVTWFADHLYTVANTYKLPQAPFIKGGSAFSVFQVALAEITKVAAYKPPSKAHRAFVVDVLSDVCDHLKLHFVPWYPNRRDNQSGRSSGVVVSNCWLKVGLASTSSNHPLAHSSLSLSESQDRQAAEAAEAAHRGDERAAWQASLYTIQRLPEILNKSKLPLDWNIRNASVNNSEPYVKETYEFVSTHYNGSKPVHQLALICAIVVSRMIPQISQPKGLPPNATGTGDTKTVTDAVRRTQWVEPNSKGYKDSLPFLVMFSTFIIAMYEPESPLRKYIAGHGEALGPSWTDKHGAKNVKPFNLVRLGVAEASSWSVFRSPKFPSAWNILSTSDINQLHKKLINTLKTPKYGPYLAMKMLVGDAQAERLATIGEVVRLPIPTPESGLPRASSSANRASSSKRQLDIIEITDDEDDVPPKRSRKRK
ncbi:hypothetical protein BJ138DRAFT_1118552 [Hygrophoropsis aurantiaca]|uniref:Uncharacterized protein n=1 Tax=Hygrophoropsis aurantiaca TaxID=72124 RepID=A0ACB7ZW31_9AGAM|nr:hypothetical protein BJ138DRAFT_1118552 [Hygrophoropsis aurantiaca]